MRALPLILKRASASYGDEVTAGTDLFPLLAGRNQIPEERVEQTTARQTTVPPRALKALPRQTPPAIPSGGVSFKLNGRSPAKGTFHMPDNATVARDLKERFPRVWCPTCNKTQPMIFDVMKANDKNEHDVADIVCGECKSIIATLHAPSVPRVRAKKAVKASEMAAQEIDRLIDPSAPDEERQRRKRQLIKGPKEFRDVRGNRSKRK